MDTTSKLLSSLKYLASYQQIYFIQEVCFFSVIWDSYTKPLSKLNVSISSILRFRFRLRLRYISAYFNMKCLVYLIYKVQSSNGSVSLLDYLLSSAFMCPFYIISQHISSNHLQIVLFNLTEQYQLNSLVYSSARKCRYTLYILYVTMNFIQKSLRSVLLCTSFINFQFQYTIFIFVIITFIKYRISLFNIIL